MPGPVLGLSTSGVAAVGLWLPGGEPVRAASVAPRAHTEELTPLVARVLDQAGLAPRDLAGIGVGTGPAPYTGLRIGLVTARALGFALAVPVWGVSDLDGLAVAAARGLGLAPGSCLGVVTDAKRREVYWAVYRVDPVAPGGVALAAGPAVGAPAAVASELAGHGVAATVGAGAALYSEQFEAAPGGPQAVDPVLLAELAWQRAQAGLPVSTEPLYLRRPDVAAPTPRKRATT
ncbi:MAG: tRNA (adenosine(37)-N6)-threonylcarbamoyltransferase complex dimerization subunit type 1 TsaB [Bifidobacteriaceae bacterium]|jgi:tRNA threonylcarbamoyladenosine biosynthesis protein TsaB|nr:tRNA (adenosine(37)-N6)-threonylcarbamoyltransferase complex dimerization subunit type 1 TsaB [Bifidobacteriaceae bacterium]